MLRGVTLATRTSAVVLAGGLLLLAAEATAGEDKGKGKDVRFEPDLDVDLPAQFVDDAWEVTTPTYQARLTRLDEAERRSFLRDTAGIETDPFARASGGPAFFTFLLELHNRSDGSLVFQPQNSLLVTNRNRILYPLDVPTLMSTFGLLDRRLPPVYEAAAPALLDGEQIVASNDSVSGLLVYRMVERRTRAFVLEMVLTTPQGEVARFVFPYKRVKR